MGYTLDTTTYIASPADDETATLEIVAGCLIDCPFVRFQLRNVVQRLKVDNNGAKKRTKNKLSQPPHVCLFLFILFGGRRGRERNRCRRIVCYYERCTTWNERFQLFERIRERLSGSSNENGLRILCVIIEVNGCIPSLSSPLIVSCFLLPGCDEWISRRKEKISRKNICSSVVIFEYRHNRIINAYRITKWNR